HWFSPHVLQWKKIDVFLLNSVVIFSGLSIFMKDFGIQHRLWVYSGRRGVHCWVCDEAVRKWSSTLRSAAVEYLSLVKGGEGTIKKVTLSDNNHIHPFIRASLDIVARYFKEYALVGQDILGNKEKWNKVLALVPENILWGLHNSEQRWEVLEKKKMVQAEREIMLQYCFPRLDMNVSKGINHLLKSPFSVHPKTGRISVPIDLKKLDDFDPFAVPTISNLCHELDMIGKDEGNGKETEGLPESSRKSRDYKKTSLAPYVKVFEQFLEEMEKSYEGQRLKNRGKGLLQKDANSNFPSQNCFSDISVMVTWAVT
uniref:DNA primase n=1 Tax=Laticauda laticaudata TaxID=8630 RepID=A0A8C5SRI2_LATLA